MTEAKKPNIFSQVLMGVYVILILSNVECTCHFNVFHCTVLRINISFTYACDVAVCDLLCTS